MTTWVTLSNVKVHTGLDPTTGDGYNALLVKVGEVFPDWQNLNYNTELDTVEIGIPYTAPARSGEIGEVLTVGSTDW